MSRIGKAFELGTESWCCCGAGRYDLRAWRIVLTMGKKGKGRKRREANFKASHDVKEMAPPPVTKDINAVPAKLRRIMQFKEAGNTGM